MTYRIPPFIEKAFEKGFSHTDESNKQSFFYTEDIGVLKVKEGKIICCDPFWFNHDQPFTTAFPTGNFPVQLAIAQIADDERVAFARLVFSDQQPVEWTMAIIEGQDISTLGAEEFFGYGVDAGTGAFLDTSAAEEFYAYAKEKDSMKELSDEMEKNYKDTRDWFVWQRNDVNVAVFHSGWGDGSYASYIGRDKDGAICRLVTDFGVID